MRDWSAIHHFLPEEFLEPEKMAPGFVSRLDRARTIAGVPFILNSTYRPDPDPEDGAESAHMVGRAADIATPDSPTRYHVVRGLLAAGFNRIGVYDLHAHVDDDLSRPPDVMWWGKSQ